MKTSKLVTAIEMEALLEGSPASLDACRRIKAAYNTLSDTEVECRVQADVGCDVGGDTGGGLDDDLDGIDTIDHHTGRVRKQADILIDIGRRHRLFHGDDGTTYARAGKAVYPIDSPGYRERLAAAYLQLVGKGCNRNAQGDAVTTLSALAKFNGKEHRVWLRTAMVGDVIYIDPGWPDWRLIEIGAYGWRIVSDGPMFRRPGAFKAMAMPSTTPDFNRLWQHVAIPQEHRVLIAAWLLASLRPGYPCPILLFSGEQGTGKSTTARMLRRLVDPSASPLRSPPKDVRDLLVGGINGWVLSLDNLSHLNAELSDALCRICTGGAINERQLYTNTDEVLVQLQRPIIANGIDDIATRPDLIERCVHIPLEPLAQRAPERTLLDAFERDVPHIFSGLLSALSAALRDYNSITEGLPRMADFAQFAAAGVPALGFSPDEFLTASESNLDDGLAASVDISPLAQAVLGFMDSRKYWKGSASALLEILKKGLEPSLLRHQAWPKTAHGLSGILRRLAPAMRRNGVDVTISRTNRTRTVTLCKPGDTASLASLFRTSASVFSPRGAPGPDAGDAGDAEKPTLHDAWAAPRPILHYRLPGDPPNAWATYLGEAGQSPWDLYQSLVTRWPAAEVRPYSV